MYTEPLFSLFGNDVYLYGVCIAVGIIACMLVFYFYTSKKKVPEKLQDFVFFVAIISIAIGFGFAALFQAFYNYLDTGVFRFSGITVMGGIIGGALTFLAVYFGLGHFLFNRGKDKNCHKEYFNEIFLVAPLCIVIAHAFGRIGCLMGGCCHGKFLSDEPVFGGIFMHTSKGSGYYVPTQLYEALFLFALFAVLSVLYFKRSNITMHIYLIAYGIWRIFIEFFRTDSRGAFVLGLSPSQWQSFVFIAIGVALLIIYHVKKIPYVLPKVENKELGQEETE